MSCKIILQPAGDGDAAEHYVDTIKNPVSLKRVQPFVSDKFFNDLQTFYPLKVAPIWGVVSGGKGVNIKKWQRVNSGDVVLFSKNNRIFSSATVTLKEHNKKLALDLWKTNRQGETWEYLYFLDQVKTQSISYLSFNRAAGYAENYVIQGFNVLDDHKSAGILAAFNLESRVYYPDVTADEFNEAIKVLSGDLGRDKQVIIAVRTEQSYLRKHLFKNKHIAMCGICDREMPVELLITAHIKPRAQCSLEERRDVANIVMPMCRLGCDDLFERGFISVGDGRIVTSDLPWLPKAITEYFSLISGRECSYWSPSAKKYFEWHKKNVFQ